MCKICRKVLVLNFADDRVECDSCHVKPYLVWVDFTGHIPTRNCPKCMREYIRRIYPTDYKGHGSQIITLHNIAEQTILKEEGEKYADYYADLEESGGVDIEAYHHKIQFIP